MAWCQDHTVIMLNLTLMKRVELQTGLSILTSQTSSLIKSGLSMVIKMSNDFESGIMSAFSNNAMSRRDGLNLPRATEWIDRFIHSLSMLCRSRPPRELCIAWANHENEDLQQWVIEHIGVYWATGIGTIEAAETMADNPEEGIGHKLR